MKGVATRITPSHASASARSETLACTNAPRMGTGRSRTRLRSTAQHDRTAWEPSFCGGQAPPTDPQHCESQPKPEVLSD
jgi:hypothetical protein